MHRDRNHYYDHLGMTQTQLEKEILKRFAFLVGLRVAAALAVHLVTRKIIQRFPD